jgi:L-fucose mutarotase/ribose pyranase (RbsD/FucU family)
MHRWLTTLVITLLAFSLQNTSVAENPKISNSAKMSRAKTLEFSRKIDAIIESHLADKELNRNPEIDDATFLRRIYLNAVGRIPNIDEAEEFLHSDGSQKRSDLIDELLGSYGYVSHQFNFLADLLRIKTRLTNNAPGKPYIDFIKDSLEENKPYDELVFELLAAEGPLLEKGNGAVGYHLRDRNMPEDNMSNTVRVFLGTRLECAQCHDHPFDKWTQRQYFEMVAFTGGINYRIEGSENYGKQIRELRKMTSSGDKKINGNVAAAVRRAIQTTTSGISGSGTGLARLPESYEGTDGKAHDVVTAKTMFDGEAIVDVKAPQIKPNKKKRKKKRKYGRNIPGAKQIGTREAYAQWLTNVDNPRFAKVISNRLWKQAFGVGLIEPVDVIEDSTVASNPELMDFLTEVMIEIDFDMKQFLRIIYNTETWQAEVTRTDVTELQKYAFPGPVMRRMSAEQIWDSMIGLTVDAIDERYSDDVRLSGAGKVDVYEFYEEVKGKSLKDTYALIESKFRGRGMMMDGSPKDQMAKIKSNARKEAKQKRKKLDDQIKQINKRINAARRAGDREKMRDLLIKRTDIVSASRSKGQQYKRASELPSPAPAKHLLREFGQSDRETIENANTDPAVTQVLHLMNGFVDSKIGRDPNSVLTRNVLMADDENEAIEAIYLTMLSRQPTKAEKRIWRKDFVKDSKTAYTDLVWTLINSNEFIFVR